MTTWEPFIALAIGLIVVIGGIVAFRIHAFLSLIAAAMVVSLLAPGEWGEKISRVATAFGDTAAGVGVVIALAAIIGRAMTESGAADRIVRMFLGVLGEKRGDVALAASGFTLAIPVFFDTVFYLLVPLARSMYRRTGRHYVKYLMAVSTSAVAHALIPPTPGPLIVASTLGVDIGAMMLAGFAVGLPAALVGLWFAAWSDRRMVLESPPDDAASATASATASAGDDRLPSLAWSLAPIILPVVLITANTVFVVIFGPEAASGEWAGLAALFALVGNANLALLVSAVIALATLWHHRRPSRKQLATAVEEALQSGGVIVLITCAGGAFGKSLAVAQVAPAIRDLFGSSVVGGIGLLLMAFAVAALIKFAQGSTTVAMITASAMFGAMLEAAPPSFHIVYLAMAIGNGALVGSWMNDSGFWIFAKMGGLTEIETLRTWTPLLALLGITGMAMTLLLAIVLPLA